MQCAWQTSWDHTNGCVSTTSQPFQKNLMERTFRHIYTPWYVFMIVIQVILQEEKHNQAGFRSEDQGIQNSVVSQNYFWATKLLTQAIPNILKSCISDGGSRRYNAQILKGWAYIIYFQTQNRNRYPPPARVSSRGPLGLIGVDYNAVQYDFFDPWSTYDPSPSRCADENRKI